MQPTLTNGPVHALATPTWLYFRKPSDVLPDPKARAVITAEEAFAELGIDRSTGYKAIREGTFPLPVVRVGRSIRIPTTALRRLLLLDEDA
jgi:excisionase family DNA binding protein